MRTLRLTTFRIFALGTAVCLPLDAEGQERSRSADSTQGERVTTTVAGRYYSIDGFKRTLLGGGWRDVWVTPIAVPWLDVSTYAGGLEVLERGGGRQSITLHLKEEHGWKEYRFRSVNKFPGMTMPSVFRDTPVGRIIQDQVSALFPGAALPVPTLLDAIGALHEEPTFVRLADDPRLGVYRDTMAGMLGTMALKGDEAPDDKPGFAGSTKVTGSEEFFEDLRSSQKQRFDEREFLAVRLIDLIINDPDRTPDNSDFARFGDSTGYTWRTIARDRDWAFMDARGLVNRVIVKSFYPKVVAFTPAYDLRGLTYSTHYHDRRLLQRLTRDDFAAIAARVQRAITDDVIDQAIAQLPPEWRAQTSVSTRLRTVLRARRDALPAVAMALYRGLATDVDIYGTDDDDRAEIVREPDGRVTVTITGDEPVKPNVSAPEASQDGGDRWASAAVPFYQRTFTPDETHEVRVYLLGGKDHATVRGADRDDIVVRLIGGYGDDVLADSAAGGGATHLYDADGDNELITGDGTHVDTHPWKPPVVANGMRVQASWRPDWGGFGGWAPAFGYQTGAGVIVGVSRSIGSYGFRRLPHAWELTGTALIGLGNGRLGLRGDADYQRENSPVAFTAAARVSQLETFRFNGYGNDTRTAGRDTNLVNQTVVSFEPAARLQIGWREREMTRPDEFTDTQRRVRPTQGIIEAGPVVTWIDPEVMAGSPLAALEGPGASTFGHVGARASLELDHTDADGVPMRGWRLRAEAQGFPPLWNLSQSFATTEAEGRVYVPIVPNVVHLAVRGGASMASGLVPVQYAPSLGGTRSLRGYASGRYTGDAAVNGSTELRVPVGTVNLLMRWNVGIFGLADAGRVWMDGESAGGWHTAFGGGIWLEALGRAVSLSYAKGEANRLYLKAGLF